MKSGPSLFSMVWASFWEFLLLFSCTWLLTLTHGLLRDQDATDQYSLTGSNGGGKSGKIVCNDTRALDVCWNKLPPIKDQGIPSTPAAVENACKVFDSGMECVNNWTNACLNKQEQEKVKSSVVGALDTYRLLCMDKRFRRQFLQHADCYKKISQHWDECARKFILSLKRVDHAKDVLSLCCIRFRFLHCVTDVANHFCSSNATQFIQRLAESLVQSTMRSYHPSQCASVTDRNCSAASSASAQSSTKALIHSSILYRLFLSGPGEQVINSLNVIQHSKAFTDISTLLGTFSRELRTYFSHQPHHHHPDSPERVNSFLGGDSNPTTTTTYSMPCNEENNSPV